MRVLLTHELYPPDLAGGGEHVVQHTAEGLRELGVDVRVLTTGDPSVTSFNGIPTERLPIHKYRFNLAARRIAEAARDADAIQTFTYHACTPSLAAARRLGKPVVMVCLGLFGDTWRQMRGPLMGRCWSAGERFLMTRPFDRVVFLSEFSRQAGIAMGVDPKISSVNCPGVQTSEFNPAAAKRNSVLFVGKIHVRKGIDLVLAAARALPQVPFEVVGWGEDRAAFERQAPPNLVFRDFPASTALWPVFESAGIFFLPSRAETFGMAVLQAMAAGCAVVSTIALPYEGAQVSVDDLPAMIAAIQRLWKDPVRQREIGRRNSIRAQEFTWTCFCTHLQGLYAELLDRRVEPESAQIAQRECH